MCNELTVKGNIYKDGGGEKTYLESRLNFIMAICVFQTC